MRMRPGNYYCNAEQNARYAHNFHRRLDAQCRQKPLNYSAPYISRSTLNTLAEQVPGPSASGPHYLSCQWYTKFISDVREIPKWEHNVLIIRIIINVLHINIRHTYTATLQGLKL